MIHTVFCRLRCAAPVRGAEGGGGAGWATVLLLRLLTGALQNAVFSSAPDAAGAKAFATGSKRAALGDIGNGTKRSTAKSTALARAVVPLDPAFNPVVEPVPAGVEDIDLVDADDPQLVATYAKEIHTYMAKLERALIASPEYLAASQKDITANMRAILLDWLVEVHLRFKLLQETLYLTINILDRFLAKVPIARSKLQLVGVTAMLLASKYEEMYPPEVRDFVWIADNAYSRAEIIQMEGLMLATLDFNLGSPLPLHFLRRLSKATEASAEVHAVGKFLAELSLGSYALVGTCPSRIAAASISIAREMFGSSPWDATLQYYSTYSPTDIAPTTEKLKQHLRAAPTAKQQAVIKKYSAAKYMAVTALPDVKKFMAAR